MLPVAAMSPSQQSADIVGSLLPAVIGSIGEADFGHHLLDLIGTVCGGDHCSILYLQDLEPAPVVAVSRGGKGMVVIGPAQPAQRAHWRDDFPLIDSMHAVESPEVSVTRFAVTDRPAPPSRRQLYSTLHIGERFLICGRGRKHALGVSILRSKKRGPSTTSEWQALANSAELLVALADRHVELVTARTGRAPPRIDIAEIEDTFRTKPFGLPLREAQVCARIVRGMTNTGIGLELGIASTTAMTYRKRAYERLEIATHHELITRYFEVRGTAIPA